MSEKTVVVADVTLNGRAYRAVALMESDDCDYLALLDGETEKRIENGLEIMSERSHDVAEALFAAYDEMMREGDVSCRCRGACRC